MLWCCDSCPAFSLRVSEGPFASGLCELEWKIAVEVAISAVCVVAGFNWDSSFNLLEDWWPELCTNTWCYQLGHTHTHPLLCVCLKFEFMAFVREKYCFRNNRGFGTVLHCKLIVSRRMDYPSFCTTRWGRFLKHHDHLLSTGYLLVKV